MVDGAAGRLPRQRVRALEHDVVLVEEGEHAERRSRHVRGGAREEQAGVDGMEPVDVLVRVDRPDHLRLVELVRQGELDEHRVDRVVLVQRRHHVPGQCQPSGGRGPCHGGSTDHLWSAVALGQQARPLDRHFGRRPCPGLAVVGRGVDIDDRVEAGIKCRQHRVGAQGGLIQACDQASGEQAGKPQAPGRHQPLRGRGQRRAVGGGQWLRIPPCQWQSHSRAILHRAQDPPDEGGVQERQVGGADERDLGPPGDRGQPRGNPLQGTQALARVVHDLGLCRQRRQ